MSGAWPLTGRAEEMSFIEAAVRRHGAGVVLAGAAGVGKTRLAREALAQAERAGMRGRWTVATTSARTLPLGPFAAGTDGWIQPLIAARTALLRATGSAGVIVAVDDAHLLDELSALLIHQIVLDRAATVVLTVRTGEPAPDAVTALWKDGHLDRVEVQPLSRAETAALLGAVLGAHVDTGAVERLWNLTRGNALYLRHVVEGEQEAGRLRRIRGVWCWPDQPALTPSLSELIAARVGDVDDALGEVLDLIALAEPLDVAVLRRLGSIAALERAESRGLVDIGSDERGLRAGLSHPLYGEVRRAGLGVLRARRLRGRIVTALAEQQTATDAVRRAVLAVDSDLPPDAGLLAVGAERAVELMDLPLAERLSRAAVAAGAGFGSAMTLAYALGWQNRGEEAEQVLVDLAGTVTDDMRIAQIAAARCGNLFWPMGQPERAESVLAAARAAIVDEQADVPLLAMQAAFDAFLCRHDLAIERGRRVLAGPPVPPQAVALCAYALVTSLGVLGRADEIGTVADDAYLASSTSFDAAELGYGVADLQISSLRLAGYIPQATDVGDALLARYRQAPGKERFLGVALHGYAALAAGHLDTAVRDLSEAHAGFGDSESSGVHMNCLLRLTQALAMTGDAPAARAALADLDAARHPAFPFLEPKIILTRAWVAAAEGVTSEAIGLAWAAAAEAVRTGQVGDEMYALQTATCFGDDTTAVRLAELAGRVDGPRASIAAVHAAALAAGDAARLEAASVRYEQMGDLLAAADAAAQAGATARARRLAARCGGARTPALVSLSSPLPLTDREREIVTLAASGLTNRQIAERLVVSVRTVEGHVYRAAAKLGTSDRTRFADLLELPPR